MLDLSSNMQLRLCTLQTSRQTNKQNVKVETWKPQRLGGCQFLLILMEILHLDSLESFGIQHKALINACIPLVLYLHQQWFLMWEPESRQQRNKGGVMLWWCLIRPECYKTTFTELPACKSRCNCARGLWCLGCLLVHHLNIMNSGLIHQRLWNVN